MPEAQLNTQWAAQFSKGLWRYLRPRFSFAGQDSFTDPPGQDEDKFEALTNVLPPVQGDLDRRWGYTLFNSSIAGGAPTALQAYPTTLWSDDPATTRQLLIGTPQGFYPVSEDGTVTGAAVNFESSIGPARGITSRGQFYVTGGGLNQRWNPTYTSSTENWGIDINNAASGPIGPDSPGTAASGAWTSPNNIKVADGINASFTVANFPNTGFHPTGTTGTITATNFGFVLNPAATITGVLVEIKNNETYTACSSCLQRQPYYSVQLTYNGANIGTFKSPVNTQPVGGGAAYTSAGASNDTWSATLNPTIVNDSTFGVVINGFVQGTGSGIPATVNGVNFFIDHVRITVYVSAPPIAITSTAGAGSVTLVSGRIYQVVFYNSQVAPQPFSDLNLQSASTGPVTSKQIALGSITVSNDPQVDRKKILATADGGDLTVMYELADLPNGQTTYTDNTPEASLLLANQYQSVLTDGTEVGVADNQPPPAGLQFPISHRGRIYGLVGSTLFFSKNEAELLTPTGVLAGRYEEEWPPLNNFPISTRAEYGRGLLSDGTVLYIGSDRRIYRLYGDGPDTFLAPQVLFENVGILNQDVWQMVFLMGNPIGAMWLTPDYRVIGADFNTYQDIGTPVQNILDTINPAAIQTAWAAYVGISIYNLYVLAVPTGSATQPNTLLVFDIKGKMWYTWQLTDTVVGGFWWVSTGGTPQFLIQALSGKLYTFTVGSYQDRIGDSPVSFPVIMRTSWLALGDGTARKYLQEIEVSTGDPNMTVTVEGASSTSEFSAPNTVAANAPLVTKPRGSELAVYLAGSFARDRYYRFTFNATDAQTDLLRSFNIRGFVVHRE